MNSIEKTQITQQKRNSLCIYKDKQDIFCKTSILDTLTETSKDYLLDDLYTPDFLAFE